MVRRKQPPVAYGRPSDLPPGLLRSPRQAAPHDPQPPLWWVGCHGGAGVTTLAQVSGFGADGGTVWPDPPSGLGAKVVLVCRTSASGTLAAEGALAQWYRRKESPYARCPESIELLGLVAVPASPRKPPPVALQRLELLAGWLPQVWRLGWIETFLAAENPADLGVPPDVDALRHDLAQSLPMKGTA